MTSLISGGLAIEMERINAAIRAEPLKADHRLALARLKLVQGDYAKALQQFQLACRFDAELAAEAQLARMLVRAEQLREAVFAGKILPDLLAAAPLWLENMIAALREEGDKAAALRQSALSEAPASKGHYSNPELTPFEWIADGDERLGPVLEIIMGESYYWIPFGQVESLSIQPPARAMDLVWASVDLKLAGRPPVVAFMPSRYLPPSEGATEAMLTGAETIWHELPGGNWIGSGRRVWMADGEPLSLFEAGSIVLDAGA